MSVVVSRVLRDMLGRSLGVESLVLDAPAVAVAAATFSPLAGIVVLGWEHPVEPDVYEIDVYVAPDGTRWVWSEFMRTLMRDPADLRAAFDRRDAARYRAEHPDPATDVVELVSAPPSPAGVVESLLDPVTREHDPGEADYDAVTAIDADGDLECVAEASAVVRRLAGRKKARVADAEHARRAARENAAAAEKKIAAKVRASVRASTMTDDEAGAADIGGFKLINPTRADVLDARKPRRRKS